MTTSNEDVSLYTMGHSSHTIDTFIDLADNFGISVCSEVRGQPYSRVKPQYNRERFREALAEQGIDYLWLGDRRLQSEEEMRSPEELAANRVQLNLFK